MQWCWCCLLLPWRVYWKSNIRKGFHTSFSCFCVFDFNPKRMTIQISIYTIPFVLYLILSAPAFSSCFRTMRHILPLYIITIMFTPFLKLWRTIFFLTSPFRNTTMKNCPLLWMFRMIYTRLVQLDQTNLQMCKRKLQCTHPLAD